jgi:hypothetical protein
MKIVFARRTPLERFAGRSPRDGEAGDGDIGGIERSHASSGP